MEILDKGKHCQEENCHQLDFLPIQCKACKKSFCAQHSKAENHNCKESSKLNFKIPVCQICNKTIEFERNKDLNACLDEHMQKCYIKYLNNMDPYKSNNNDLKVKSENDSKKCQFKKCKTSEIFRFKCDSCQLTFCTKHRVPEIHKCEAVKLNQPSKSNLNQATSLLNQNSYPPNQDPYSYNQNAVNQQYNYGDIYDVYEVIRIRFNGVL